MTSLVLGLLYTDWEAGPWWGLKSKDRAGVEIGWINLGDTGQFYQFGNADCWMPYDCPGKPPHYVWRHTCASIDFTTGLTRLVENGRLVKEVTDQELVRMYQVLPGTN